MFLRAHSVLLWLLSQVIQLDPEADEFKCTTVIQHAYPPTQLQWSPPGVARESGDVLATVGDYLRLWKVPTELREAETISRPEHLFDSVRCASTNFAFNRGRLATVLQGPTTGRECAERKRC